MTIQAALALELEKIREKGGPKSSRRKLTPHEYNIRNVSATGVDFLVRLRATSRDILTSAVFPERYGAVLLREIRWLERVLVLEFPMRRLAAGERDGAGY